MGLGENYTLYSVALDCVNDTGAGSGRARGAMHSYFADIEKRTEAEKGNLFVVPLHTQIFGPSAASGLVDFLLIF